MPKIFIFHYNLLPPFSEKKYLLGKRVVVVGAGNVMMDVAHYLVRDRKVEEVIVVVRRGPADVKFTKKEMENVARNLDMKAFDCEFARCGPHHAIGWPGSDRLQIRPLDALPKSLEPVSKTRFRFSSWLRPCVCWGIG